MHNWYPCMDDYSTFLVLNKYWNCLILILTTGSNPIYNLLPDILGKLCNRNLKRESFCNIMQFLIGSIKKV